MSAAVTVVINGESREVPPGLSVNEMLAQLGIPAGRVAIEYNQDILPRSRWDQTRVQSGDRFEIVHFVGGGSQQPISAYSPASKWPSLLFFVCR